MSAAIDLQMLASEVPYLESSGWIQSRKTKRPVDRLGQPLPWYTYPAIEFLDDRIRNGLDVFEFGSGNSTLWWASRVATVQSVEHHEGWAAEMSAQLPGNVIYRQIDLQKDGDYSRAAATANETFDVIIIDGRDRVNCLRHSLDTLREGGVIVWDNSERGRYERGYTLLDAAGFRRLRFRGLGPINRKSWETSVFYRSDNCLGI